MKLNLQEQRDHKRYGTEQQTKITLQSSWPISVSLVYSSHQYWRSMVFQLRHLTSVVSQRRRSGNARVTNERKRDGYVSTLPRTQCWELVWDIVRKIVRKILHCLLLLIWSDLSLIVIFHVNDTLWPALFSKSQKQIRRLPLCPLQRNTLQWWQRFRLVHPQVNNYFLRIIECETNLDNCVPIESWWYIVYTLFPREEPFVFQIGRQKMIEGWEKGLLDMCVGEKRKLVVPSGMVCSNALHQT